MTARVTARPSAQSSLHSCLRSAVRKICRAATKTAFFCFSAGRFCSCDASAAWRLRSETCDPQETFTADAQTCICCRPMGFIKLQVVTESSQSSPLKAKPHRRCLTPSQSRRSESYEQRNLQQNQNHGKRSTQKTNFSQPWTQSRPINVKPFKMFNKVVLLQ